MHQTDQLWVSVRSHPSCLRGLSYHERVVDQPTLGARDSDALDRAGSLFDALPEERRFPGATAGASHAGAEYVPQHAPPPEALFKAVVVERVLAPGGAVRVHAAVGVSRGSIWPERKSSS